ncbi:MAG: hypothetical protein J1E97_06895 [Muribaculaceae bacterium]|nr:hypothetical protein [Muribaculaceae bacterium]
MKPIISILCVALLLGFTAEGKNISTRLKPEKTVAVQKKGKKRITEGQKTPYQKVADKLTFMAYDKKASSDKETFFVDNGSETTISNLKLEISYFTTKGKLIHRRVVDIYQTFPGLETRKVDISSWDKQKSFHFINSVPSTKGSTAYTVKFKVISFDEE